MLSQYGPNYLDQDQTHQLNLGHRADIGPECRRVGAHTHQTRNKFARG